MCGMYVCVRRESDVCGQTDDDVLHSVIGAFVNYLRNTENAEKQ